jgi:hypothetical protein
MSTFAQVWESYVVSVLAMTRESFSETNRRRLLSRNYSGSVAKRFGVLPNFFRLSPETPEITERLWGFAQAAYLDNPHPSVFKERLFVYLSRFCVARYCIARHTGFLIGLGRPAGDRKFPRRKS